MSAETTERNAEHRRTTGTPAARRVDPSHPFRPIRSDDPIGEGAPKCPARDIRGRMGLPTRAFVARHRRIAGLAAALFLVLVAGAVALGPTGVLSNQTPTQFEGLAKVGPTDPQLHFPAWY